MSEFAQQRLEKLLPVFEELQRVQLFTNDEVRRIIKKCKSYEHKLEKRVKSKDEFLKYIQYLVYFLALIRERRQEIKYFFKKKEIDYAIGARIESLFRAACHRFQADINLWLSRIEFAKTQQLHTSVSRIFMRLLQVHTDKPYLWIAAAKWEFEENGSAESARSLLQRGLRFNSECQKLYQELFRLELLYIEKLRQRNDALQGQNASVVGEDNDADLQNSNETSTVDVSDAILQGKLARLVFDDAAQVFEGDVHLCVQFAIIAREFSFAGDLVDFIYEQIQLLYGNKEEAHAALADRRYFENPFDLGGCEEVFEKAVACFRNGKIWQYYIQFYLKCLEESCPNRSLVLEKCLEVFSRAAQNEKRALDDDLYTKWISLCDDQSVRGEIAEKALESYPKSSVLWEQFLKSKILSRAPLKDVMNAFNDAVRVLPEKETLPLWRMALSWSAIACPKRVGDLLKSSQILDSSVSAPLKICHLQWMLATQDLDSFRSEFRQICEHKPNALEFYLEYYAMERAQVEPDSESVRFSFEQALFEYGSTSTDLWLRYVDFELRGHGGDPAKVSKIYNRAIKKLDEECVEDFMREYLLLTKS